MAYNINNNFYLKTKQKYYFYKRNVISNFIYTQTTRNHCNMKLKENFLYKFSINYKIDGD